MKIAICDDDAAQAEYFCALVRKWSAQGGAQAETACFASAEAFRFAWSADKSFDALLLDIQMKGEDGVSLARGLRREGGTLAIIFVTGFADYMAEGYDVEAMQYLLKPVKEEKLFSCLDRLLRRAGSSTPALLIDADGETVRLKQEEIILIEAFAHTCEITASGRKYGSRRSLGELAKSLDRSLFCRPHRSYLVGLRFVEKIGRSSLTLESGAEIPVSRRLISDVNKAFLAFYRGKASE